MMRGTRLLVLLATVTAAGGMGFYLGHQWPDGATRHIAGRASAPRGPVIYYQHPDGEPVYSSEPRQTQDGRLFRAVPASEDISFDEKPKASHPSAGERKVLYYRNPMGLPDVSPTPKKDSMGMDYIPVYDGEDQDGAAVTVSLGKQQRAGVSTQAAQLRVLSAAVSAPGIIQLDERKVSVISVRTESFINSVDSITTGETVRKNQPLLRLYSPTITAAAADYAAVLSASATSSTSAGSRQRLLNFGAPVQFLEEIERTRSAPITFTWVAPRDGIVLERNVTDGMRAMPGDVLFRIAGLDIIWAVVDIAERDLASVHQGQQVAVKVRSYPNRSFLGKVSLIYPQLNAATRTLRVRIELPNPELILRPDMYAEAEIYVGGNEPVLAVPDSAVIDSGDRQIVIVDKGSGRFEPRPVKLGRRGSGYTEVLDGIEQDEPVVTSATFLIDAESNLKAALKGLSEGAK